MRHALTLIITRDVENRHRGLLHSAMLEVSTGVYVSLQMNQDARDRVWAVLSKWYQARPRGSIVMIWRDRDGIGNVGARHLGEISRYICEVDGILLTRIRKSEI